MALTRHLLLILLLLVALHAKVCRAAPWRVRGADEAGGSGYPASGLDVGLEPLGHPGDPLEVDGFPFSSSVAVVQSENSPTETDREAAQEAAYPEGSSGSLPAYAAQAEAMRSAGTPVIAKPRQDRPSRVYRFVYTDSDVDSERTLNISPPPRSQSVFMSREMVKRCMIGAAVVAVAVPIALLLCCVWMRWRRRKEGISADSAQQLETGSCPSPPQSRTSRPGTAESGDECQQLLPPWSPPLSYPLNGPPSPPPSRPPSPFLPAFVPKDPPSTPRPLCPASPYPAAATFYISPSSSEPQPEQPPQPLSPLVQPSSKGTRRPLKAKYRHKTFHHQGRRTLFPPRLRRDRVLRY
ncbi:uncharacterized protein LOC141947799 isoform X1 [Strix uralensis]|uniref:uncharacterized protein LOC141947799 isoform X1 n=1 Tax=Strix uralensis TaxID=36305 RepID=UPI003DA3537A